MRENGIRSFVTRNGQVIRVPAEEVETHPQRQQPSSAEGGTRASAGQDQHRPPAGADGRAAGRAAMGGGMDMSRLAALILLGFVCFFLMTLAVAGIYKTGKLAFNGKSERAGVVIRDESNRRDMKTVDSLKPKVARNEAISPRTFSYPDARSEVNEKDYGQQVQPRKRWKQEIPTISREPAVDYWDSIDKMKDAIETQGAEIKKITEDLRIIIERSGEGD